MELIFFSTAFVCGFILHLFKLPPLIGFLAAGFILNLTGYQSTALLESIAGLGVTLLLFSIGLKLRVSNLTKTHVWAPASLHLIISTALFGAFMQLMSLLGIP